MRFAIPRRGTGTQVYLVHGARGARTRYNTMCYSKSIQEGREICIGILELKYVLVYVRTYMQETIYTYTYIRTSTYVRKIHVYTRYIPASWLDNNGNVKRINDYANKISLDC